MLRKTIINLGTLLVSHPAPIRTPSVEGVEGVEGESRGAQKTRRAWPPDIAAQDFEPSWTYPSTNITVGSCLHSILIFQRLFKTPSTPSAEGVEGVEGEK